MAKIEPQTEVVVYPDRPFQLSRLAHKSGNIKQLTGLFLGDLQDHWREHGIKALTRVCDQYPELYVAAMVTLTKAAIARQVDVNMQHTVRIAQSKEDILAKLEEQSGPRARELFENLVSKIEEMERGPDTSG